MRTDIRRLFLWMAVFFVAMAFLESAVVVYLRALYYPGGFEFPLVPMDPLVLRTEVIREMATLVMLLVPGALVTRSALERFAWFCFGFGIWDIFYYGWLKVLLDWPASLASPDLLFLVPVPWVGPVWAPCVISLGLIALAVLILRGRSVRPSGLVDGRAWALLISGAFVMVVSFTLEPLLSSFGLEVLCDTGVLADGQQVALRDGLSYVPAEYPWPLFLLGCAIAAAGLHRVGKRGHSAG